jgi:prepilin-type processing-associated H-X9-DG protein
MLIVIAIISILTGILLPVIAKARGRGTRVNCAANLKQIGYALDNFANDFEGVYPNEYWHWSYNGNDNSGRTLGMLVPGYVEDTKLFQCPGGSDPSPTMADAGADQLFKIFTSVTSYSYHRVLLKKSLAKVIVATDEDAIGTDYLNVPSSPNHNYEGANLLWIDGHVTWHACRSREQGVVMTEKLYSTDHGVGEGSSKMTPLAEDRLGENDSAQNYASTSTQSPHDIFVRMAP